MADKNILTVLLPEGRPDVARWDSTENQVVVWVDQPDGRFAVRLRVNCNGAISLVAEGIDPGVTSDLFRGVVKSIPDGLNIERGA